MYVRNNTYVRKQKDKCVYSINSIYTINCLDTGKVLVDFAYNYEFGFKENKFFGVIDDNKDYNKKFILDTITKEITYI